MNSIILNLLNMSISATYVIIAILILRLLFKKIPRFTFCIMWGFVAFRLICPFSIESIFSLLPRTDIVERVIAPNTFLNNNLNIAEDNNIENIIKTSINGGASKNATENIDIDVNKGINNTYIDVNGSTKEIFIIDIISFTVTSLILLYGILSYYRLKKQVDVSITYKDNIRICDNIEVPFILGFIKPKVYIPSELKEPELKYILAHENAHIARKDYIWKTIGFVLLSIYWFNPFIWLAYILFCKDIELATDDKVLKELGEDSKVEYSKTLLTYSTNNQKLITACPVAFGETGVKERIKSILNYKKPTLIAIITAIIVCIIVVICFLTNPTTDIYNAENLNYEEILSLQNEVDNGHYPWRLDVSETAVAFMKSVLGIDNIDKDELEIGEIKPVEVNSVKVKYSNFKEAIVYISYLNVEYELKLFKPLEKNNSGIWIVKEYNQLSENNLYIGLVKDDYKEIGDEVGIEILNANGELKTVLIDNPIHLIEKADILIYSLVDENRICYQTLIRSILGAKEVENVTKNSIKLKDEEQIIFKNKSEYDIVFYDTFNFYEGNLEDIEVGIDLVEIEKINQHYYIIVHDRGVSLEDHPEITFHNLEQMFLDRIEKYYYYNKNSAYIIEYFDAYYQSPEEIKELNERGYDFKESDIFVYVDYSFKPEDMGSAFSDHGLVYNDWYIYQVMQFVIRDGKIIEFAKVIF